MNARMERLRQRLAEIATIENVLDQRMYALAIITEALADIGIRPILVGGCAVEFYTYGGYATRDMDVVMPASPGVDAIMAELGFAKSGRYWTYEELGLVVESPGSTLAGDTSRIWEVETKAGLAYVIGLEDLIIDRLNAYVYWKSDDDGRWAERLIAGYPDRIDWSYLDTRARQERVEEALATLRQKAQGT